MVDGLRHGVWTTRTFQVVVQYGLSYTESAAQANLVGDLDAGPRVYEAPEIAANPEELIGVLKQQ